MNLNFLDVASICLILLTVTCCFRIFFISFKELARRRRGRRNDRVDILENEFAHFQQVIVGQLSKIEGTTAKKMWDAIHVTSEQIKSGEIDTHESL